MTTIKKMLTAALITTPLLVSAAGMGLYIPVNIMDTTTIDYTDRSTNYDLSYKLSPGFGISFDSNIGKDKLYSYRLGLEYQEMDLDTVNDRSVTHLGYTKTKFNIVNTFGFGVFRTKVVRLWVGPRLNVQIQSAESSWDPGYERSDVGVGLGLAAGINVNLGKVVSLAFDADYHAVSISGSESTEDEYCDSYGCYTFIDSRSYSAVEKGLTARFYLLFRFGEQFQREVPVSLIDQSL